MRIYNITKGQLITLWAFGFFFWVWVGDLSSIKISDSFRIDPFLLILLIPFILIFYTIGWKNDHDNE